MDLNILAKASDLKDRILFTIFTLIVFRLGSYIPLPGINSHALDVISSQNAGGILGMFNMLSGGSLGRMSIFALAIMPYITSSIIVQLMTVVFKSLENLKKEGEAGRRKINQYTRYLTVFLAAFQGYGIVIGLEQMVSGDLTVVTDPGILFRITSVITLVGGTIFLMWLGGQISSKGIGNGTSLIIFSGIVAGLPKALASMFELGRTGALSVITILLIVTLSIAMIAVIVLFERSFRKIPVQYPQRQVGNKIYAGDTTHIPLKINTSGVIPPIFASSILLLPLTVVNLSQGNNKILQLISTYLAHGKPLYILSYIALICFFSFFYTAITFNPEETAENLKKYGGFVPGRRPGKNTAEYFDYVLTRLTVIGASYMSVICIIPEILVSHYSIPFYLGGTSILIVVNVVIESFTQIQTHLFSHQYENLMKKVKIRDKRS